MLPIYPYTLYFASRTNTPVLYGHQSFTQGSQQSEKITNLNVEEEEEKKRRTVTVQNISGTNYFGYETGTKYQSGTKTELWKCSHFKRDILVVALMHKNYMGNSHSISFS